MAFCTKCGSNINDGVSFCPNCGAAIGAAPPQGSGPSAPPPYTPPYNPQSPPNPQYPPQYPPYPAQASGLQENVAGMLCYLVGWLTGIIFLVIDKRPFVRFHAAQSIVVFGALHVLQIILTYVWIGSGYHPGFWAIHGLISGLVGLITLAAWIILMLMAYQGKRFEVPGAAGIAYSITGKIQ